jgi:F0F1-type ATP synthase membrane subunit b/b'
MMPDMQMEWVVAALILIDLFIVILFFVLIWKLKYFDVEDTFNQKIQTLENLLSDADQLSGALLKTLEDKHRILQQMDEKFEQRIAHLEQLMERADQTAGSLEAATVDQQIHQFFQDGMTTEAIAEKLAIPKEKVTLVLNMKKK